MRYWPGLGPMLQTDEMTFEIWDETLQTISRHSLKGKLAGWFPAKNSECVLLSLTAGQPETPELLRTYTLSLL